MNQYVSTEAAGESCDTGHGRCSYSAMLQSLSTLCIHGCIYRGKEELCAAALFASCMRFKTIPEAGHPETAGHRPASTARNRD